MTSIDPYRVTDTLDDAVLDAIATRLEVRGQHPVFVRMMDEYLDAMGIDDAGRSSTLAAAPVSRRVASPTDQDFPGTSPASTAAHFSSARPPNSRTMRSSRVASTSVSAIRKASILATASSMRSSLTH